MRRGIRITFQAFLILLVVLTLSGCWDLEEVDRRALVTTLGIDLGADGEVILSAHIPKSRQMLPPSTAGGSGVGKSFSPVSVTGRTVEEAFGVLQTETYRRAAIQLNRAVIIGERAARNGVRPLVDWLLHYPKAPTRALVLVANGKTAKEIMNYVPDEQALPGLQLAIASQSKAKETRAFFIPIRIFEQKIIHPSKDPYATLLDFDVEQRRYRIAGIAVFKGARLVRKLDVPETQSFGIMSGLLHGGSMTFDLPNEGKNRAAITLRTIRLKRKIKVQLRQGLPFFAVSISLKGELTELKGETGRLSPAKIARLEKQLEGVIKPKLDGIVRELQRANADVIDFGEKLRIQQFEYWKKINWREVYPKASFRIDLQVRITRDGTIR